uniref:C-type lectin domain-containing protein n=1 Tax=Stomoxys calcitrans TaxID=35570 RepID=A0A1I8QAG8_STOCA
MNPVILYAFLVLLIWCQAYAGKFYTTQDRTKLYYIESDKKFNWYEAQRQCSMQNMSLITLDSAKRSQQFTRLCVAEFYYNFPNSWIGGHGKRDGTYAWISTGYNFNYNRWQKHQPSGEGEGKCVIILSNTHEWASEDCSQLRGFVCESLPILWETSRAMDKLKSTLETQKEEVESISNKTLHITKHLQMKDKEIEELNKTYESNKKKLIEFECQKGSYQSTEEKIRNTETEIDRLQNSNKDQSRLLQALQVEIDRLTKVQELEKKTGNKEFDEIMAFVKEALEKQKHLL